MYDGLEAITESRFRVGWGTVHLTHNGHQLDVQVFRDAMKFDNVPAMTWHREPVPPTHKDYGKTYNGVRLPVTAVEMQQIADLTYCMMLTPKVVDAIWAAAKAAGVQINSVVGVHGQIVAISDIQDVHAEVEAALTKPISAVDPNGIIDSVGKYWVICNELLAGKFSHIEQADKTFINMQATNYGWPDANNPVHNSVTMICHMWQTIGSEHNYEHIDPSQVIRLMSRLAKLCRAGSTTWEEVDLFTIAQDPDLCGLISHQGVLKILRQPGAPEPQPTQNADGSYTMPETIIIGS